MRGCGRIGRRGILRVSWLSHGSRGEDGRQVHVSDGVRLHHSWVCMYRPVGQGLGGHRDHSGGQVGEGVGRLQVEQGGHCDRDRRHPSWVVARLVEVVEAGVRIHAGHSRRLSYRVPHQVALDLADRHICGRRSAMIAVVAPDLSTHRLALRQRCHLAALEEALASARVRCVDLARASRRSVEYLLPAWVVAPLESKGGQ